MTTDVVIWWPDMATEDRRRSTIDLNWSAARGLVGNHGWRRISAPEVREWVDGILANHERKWPWESDEWVALRTKEFTDFAECAERGKEATGGGQSLIVALQPDPRDPAVGQGVEWGVIESADA